MREDSIALTREFLKANDRDRYQNSLLARGEARDAIQALFAFSADVAAVRERVHEPAPGEIRLQWWHDALEGEQHGDVSQNPVADALLWAVDTCRLPRAPLLALIAARRFDLYDDPMPDIGTFEGYAGETVSVLFQLAAMVLDGGREVPGSADAAGHMGVADALLGHIRAFGFNASRGRLFLPASVFAAHGVAETDIFSGNATEGMRNALGQLREMAIEHLARAQAAAGKLPGHVRPAVAHIGVLRHYARLAERQVNEPFAPPGKIAEWRRILALVFSV